MTREIVLKVLSLNCWAIPYVSKDRKIRINAIAQKLSSGEYNVICLQEVWSVKDFFFIQAQIRDQLSYSHYFYSGVFGSGICIFSSYPIEDVIFHKWPLNGYVHKIQHADWFGGKGVGLCRLNVQGIKINVYIAHLHAEYNKKNDQYMAHRVLQAFDTAQFIKMTSGNSDAVILAGDLNAEPNSLAYKIICGIPSLQNVCSNDLEYSGTCDCAYNSYTNSRVARKFPKGQQIDHILFSGSKNIKIEAINFEHPFPRRIPDKNFSYSDHEAIMATFNLTNEIHEVVRTDTRECVKEALGECRSSLKSICQQRLWYLVLSLLVGVPLFVSLGWDCTITSIGFSVLLNLVRIFLTTILCYALFMSTLWSNVETNSLKAGCSAMELYLINYHNKMSEK